MTEPLYTFRRLHPDTHAVAVIDPDGALLAVAAPEGLEGMLGPTSTTLTTLADATLADLGRGSLRCGLLEGAFGRIVFRDLGNGSVLVVVTGADTRLGLLLDDVDALCNALGQEVAA